MIRLVFFYFDISSLIKKKNILGFGAFPAGVCLFVCFFFRAIDYIIIARRIRCSAGVSRKGRTPLFGLDGNVPLSRACFTRMWRLDVGESLFKLFASLCLSLSDDANKIKTLNIERQNSFSYLWKFDPNAPNGFGEILF